MPSIKSIGKPPKNKPNKTKLKSRPTVLVIGIGNEIRHDDAVGLIVAEEVRHRIRQCSRITVKKLSAGGWQLLHEIEGFDQLVVVDAHYTAKSKPGRLRIHADPEQMPVRDIDAASAHLLSIPDAIALSKKYGYHTPALLGMVTIDVGENCLTFGTGLSPSVEAVVQRAADAVIELIKTT